MNELGPSRRELPMHYGVDACKRTTRIGASSLLKNLGMESFLILSSRCWGGAVELDVIF
jgi:hypothetical protein